MTNWLQILTLGLVGGNSSRPSRRAPTRTIDTLGLDLVTPSAVTEEPTARMASPDHRLLMSGAEHSVLGIR